MSNLFDFYVTMAALALQIGALQGANRISRNRWICVPGSRTSEIQYF